MSGRFSLLKFLLLLCLMSPALAELKPCAVCSTEQGRIHQEECSLQKEVEGQKYFFCQASCQKIFLEEPKSWASRYQALLNSSDTKKTEIAEGDSLPRFRLPLKPIGSISTEDLLGKVVLINGWASWCAPCMEEMPHLVKLQEELKEQDLVVIGLSFDKSEKKHQETVSALGLNFPSIYADQPEVQEFLQSVGEFKVVPFTIIVNKDGKLVKRLNESATYDEFKRLVEPLLEKKKPKQEASTGSVVPS